MEKTILKTNNLTKSYGGINRVDHINLNIREGSIYGFLGPNGAGKSTTMKMLTNLVKPTDGKIKIFGKQLSKGNRTEILSLIGSLIEGPSFYGHLSANENMKILETILDLKEGTGIEKLKLVGLEKEKDKKINEFSIGMKQRFGIAVALLKNPKLLILDEPTNGLDPAGTQEMRELLRKLSKEDNITIMISTHLLSEIEKIADDVGILNKGKLIFQGSLEELEHLALPETRIRTSNNQKAFDSINSYNSVLDSNNLIINNLNDENRAEIISKLVNEKLDIYEVSKKENSLEDLFLKVTDRL